tara:strand:- start:30 stop:1277 length:1248 start_codon:yes stop_codon:yes gene_type:complete
MLDILYEEKNTHLEHLEDDIINNGGDGGDNAINFLSSIRNMLQAKTDKKVNISVKWDGAPAIVCGINPENGKFFVGTKSVFNKTPKINYTIQDIKNNHTGELVNILRECLEYLSVLNIKGIIQGDLLFKSNGKKKSTYKGADGKSESMIAFTPNTITYMIPENTDLGKRINRAKLGIIFHTTYKGSKIEKLSAKFGADVSKLRNSANVFFDDASYKNVSGAATMTLGEGEAFEKILNMARGSLKKSRALLNRMPVEDNPLSVGVALKTYLNSFIRAGTDLPSTKETASNFKTFYAERVQKDIDRVKTDKAKEKYKLIQDNGLKFIDKANEEIYFAMATYKTIQRAKKILIDKLNKAKTIGTFVKDGTGLKATNPEGYVAVDTKGKAVKLVDRLEFSVQNFTIDKNWDKGQPYAKV